MNKQKQTAVEWLFHKLWDEPKDKFTWYSLLKQAKHKEQETLNKTISNIDIELAMIEDYAKGEVGEAITNCYCAITKLRKEIQIIIHE